MAILCWAAKNSLRGTVAGLLRPRLGCARFALNFFSLVSEIKWNWILFTCVSLFHYKISLHFFRFFSLISLQIFASLHFSNFFRSETKRSKIQVYFFAFFAFFHFFCFFCFFLLFFVFFCFFFAFFRIKFFASLRCNNFCFDAKQCEAKFKSIFPFFFFAFFAFFRLIFVLLRFFCLIFAYFTFVFASDFWCFASKWIMWNQVFFLLPS